MGAPTREQLRLEQFVNAAGQGNVEQLRMFLADDKPVDVNGFSIACDATAMEKAIQNSDDASVVTFLLDRGALLQSVRDPALGYSGSPLGLAVLVGRPCIVKTLLECGAKDACVIEGGCLRQWDSSEKESGVLHQDTYCMCIHACGVRTRAFEHARA